MVLFYTAFLSLGFVDQEIYRDMIDYYSHLNNVQSQKHYILGIAEVESGFRNVQQEHISKASTGSHGIFQILYSTAKSRCSEIIEKFEHLYEPERNIACGIKIFTEDFKKYKNPSLAIAAYNSGTPFICTKAITCIKGQFVNQKYVNSVLTASKKYKKKHSQE